MMTAGELKSQKGFLKTWTGNGKNPINRIGDSNFWIPGKNRKRGTILRPDELQELVEAGVITKVNDFQYQFVKEAK